MSVVANELCKLIVFHIEDFRNCKCIIFLECIFLYIFKIISDSLYLLYHLHTGSQSVRTVRLKGREAQIFLDIDDRVDAESCQPFVKPPVDHLIDFLSQFRVLPVEIRLFFCKHMQIIQIRPRHRLPCASAEIGTVIARLLAVFPFYKMKISRIFPVRIFQRPLKPLMLVRTVVYHQIHQDIHAALLRLSEQLVELLHRAEFFCDLVIIGYIISLVHKRGLIHRGKPDNVNSQIFEII